MHSQTTEPPELDLWIESQRGGITFHPLPQSRAHHIAEFLYNLIGEKADLGQSLLAHSDRACVTENGEVLGDICLTGSGGFHQLPYGALALHQNIEQTQANGFGDYLKAAGNEIQGKRRKLVDGFGVPFSAH